MYYYGQNYPYGGTGYAYPTNTNNGIGGWFAIILVIFILLVIMAVAGEITGAVPVIKK